MIYGIKRRVGFGFLTVSTVGERYDGAHAHQCWFEEFVCLGYSVGWYADAGEVVCGGFLC